MTDPTGTLSKKPCLIKLRSRDKIEDKQRKIAALVSVQIVVGICPLCSGPVHALLCVCHVCTGLVDSRCPPVDVGLGTMNICCSGRSPEASAVAIAALTGRS